jgi:hypothetical protein
VQVVAAGPWLVGLFRAHFFLFFREATDRLDVH